MSISITSHGWTPLGTHTFARRYESFDLTVGVVIGAEGVLIVDTRASTAEGRTLLDHVRELSNRPILGVVNTHQHYDHTLGNAAFENVPVIGHESLATTLEEHLEEIRDDVRSTDDGDPHNEQMLASPTRVPDVTFASVWSIDLGDCLVEAVHPGPGHTAGDIVVKVVPDRVAFAGDLVEESGPPSYGSDSYPFNWGAALDFTVGVCEPDATVVPGHGDAVDRDFVQEQRRTILEIAEHIRSARESGMSVDEALRQQQWPVDASLLEHAVRRGFDQLAEQSA